jgi:hypothetical protein
VNADLVKLATACERALVDGARQECAGTRQQLRAAARRFVRRHRRDSRYLGWVLRCVAASSALAVALLGLGAAPAAAKLAPYQISGQPFSQDVGSYAAPTLGDIDGDGDLDAVVGAYPSGIFRYFENTGSVQLRAFIERTLTANPLTGFDVGIWSIPTLADLDADGDLDLVSGESSGVFFYFENTFSANLPAFVPRTGAANPLNGVDIGGDSFPSFGDLDADGDLDLVVGEYYGTFRYFENTGNARTPAFAARTGAQNPLNGVDVGSVSTPSLADLDRDGDLDLVSGEADSGAFRVFENTGNVKVPAFAPRTGAANPLDGQNVGSLSSTALGDLDADGDLELLAGNRDGLVAQYAHQMGDLVQRTGALDPLNAADVGNYSAPTLADLDADGDADMFSGELAGGFRYFQNTGSSSSPAFVERTSFPANPLGGSGSGGNRSTPALVDLDGDNDRDFVTGTSQGTLGYWQNTGTAANPIFVFRPPGVSPVGAIDIGTYSSPAFGDVDGDGDPDLLIGSSGTTLRYYENTGSAGSPQFIQRFDHPFTGVPVGFPFLQPAFVDLERDGDLDVFVGNQTGDFFFLQNTGTPTSPAYVNRDRLTNHPLALADPGDFSRPAFVDLNADGLPDAVAGSVNGTFAFYESFVRQSPFPLVLNPGPSHPLNGQDVGALAAPALADLDRDGDDDMIVGEDGGTFRYFENTGDALSPRFLARTGAANPLNGRDVGDEAKPALADLDGDGDFDLLAGNLFGQFNYFRNTGNAKTPAFAAPLFNALGLSSVADNAAPAFGDVDRDGDLDLTVGVYYQTLIWFENTFAKTEPAFVFRFGADNPFGTLNPTYYTTPAIADFDLDGDLDLYTGREHGRLDYYDDAGDAVLPLFERVAGIDAYALEGLDFGERVAPGAGQLNGDGLPDLVIGDLDGTFDLIFIPEPGHGAMLGAGLALLGWLRRLRRSRSAR